MHAAGHIAFRVLSLKMGPEEAAFLDRVCADPDDDAPRLIFADWLDERGDPRGEFIPVQVALAQLSAGDRRRGPLLDREAALLARHHKTWSDPLRRIAGGAQLPPRFLETGTISA